jgi:hypothetical protein
MPSRQSPAAIDAVAVSHGSVVLIEVKTARKHMEGELRRLAQAEQTMVSDPEIMSSTPVYRGTRIPVHAIADMFAQGATTEEILEGCPGSLVREWNWHPCTPKHSPEEDARRCVRGPSGNLGGSPNTAWRADENS